MYLFFDVETTGLPINYQAPLSDLENWPRIVQIAWSHYDDEGNELSRNSYIVKPNGFTIPSRSTEIHKITTEDAIEQGTNLNEVLNEFSSAIEKSTVLIAHNIDFDQKVVGAEFLREKVSNNLFEKKTFCTMKHLPPTFNSGKWPKLLALHTKLFNTGFEGAHHAMTDVEICAKCFWELKKQGVIS